MKASTLFRPTIGSVLLTFALVLSAGATEVLNVTTSLSASDATQLGRLSRNGIPQDWVGTEPFPGTINPATSYHYQTFVIAAAVIGLGPYIQISFDDVFGNLFVSAYTGSYLPNSSPVGDHGFDTNWLGDAGFSGNAFGTDPLFFQVLAPVGQDLVVVVNQAAFGNTGLNESFNLLVESFTDTDYTDPVASAAVPDSGTTALLLGLALSGLALVRRRTPKTRSAGSKAFEIPGRGGPLRGVDGSALRVGLDDGAASCR